MINSDDAKRLLIRELGLADDVKRRDTDPSLGLANLLARTTTLKTYPATAQCYYACQPLKLLGAEVEGGPAIVSAATATYFALNVGSAIPPSETQVVTTFVGNRWVFRYDG